MIWIKRIENKRPRVVCYWNMSEVKEEKLKWNMKGRSKKTSQSNNVIKQTTEQRKLNGKKRNKKINKNNKK